MSPQIKCSKRLDGSGRRKRRIHRPIQHQVAIGWNALGLIRGGTSREEMADAVAAIWPNYKKGKVSICAGQIFRFLRRPTKFRAAEERQIGEVLRAADQKILDFRSDLEKAKKLKAGLMSDLLGGAVEVSA